MTALVYFFVAVLAAALGVRAWLPAQDEPIRRAFLGLGVSLATTYLSFALSLLPGLGPLRLLYLAAGCTVPAFFLWVVDGLFGAQGRTASSPSVARLFVITTLFVLVTTALQGAFFLTVRASPPAILAGVFTCGAVAYAVYRLWEVRQASELRVDRLRIAYLTGLAIAAATLTAVEQIGRLVAAPLDPSALELGSRVLLLQGPIPPLSALAAGVGVYFLYHTLQMRRLVDLHEIVSRGAALAASAALLVVVDAITLVWFGTFANAPLHGTYQMFLGSVLFLAAYDPIREPLERAMARFFNQRGQQLADELALLRRRLPSVISTPVLADTLLSRLQGTGRAPVCSMYLWNPNLDGFGCVAHRGFGDIAPLAAVAARPFTDALAAGEQPWYFRATIERLAKNEPKWGEVLQLMDTMRADLSLPFVSRGLVLGWLNLRDEDWSDGYSADELERFADIAELASVVLSNIHDVEALEQQHRLTALGAMAAGLAHEIRNPLAGIKGATQYLQNEQLGDVAQDMLQVVIDETDRLNQVVSQFLDYARPYQPDLQPDHVNALVGHVLAVLRAGGLPAGVTLVEELAPDLPQLRFDRTRLGQVLLNILHNAVQAMPDGGTLTVTTRRRVARGTPVLEIAVTDTGVGIDAEARKKLFVPFYTTKASGTGLGLPISQRIVHAHGGELDVVSWKGRGSTFTIRLPLPVALDEG